jgi:hypothetical protein
MIFLEFPKNQAHSSRAIIISDASLLFMIMLKAQAFLLFYKRLEPHYYF